MKKKMTQIFLVLAEILHVLGDEIAVIFEKYVYGAPMKIEIFLFSIFYICG